MRNGVFFALLSLCFAGVIDVFYKKYSGKERSRGMLILGIGVVWAVLQWITFKISVGGFSPDAVSIGFGLLAGAVLVVSNVLLVESFTHIDVGLGSTIYRLNTIGVVLLSFFFLAEPLPAMKITGILLGLASVCFLYQRSHRSVTTTHYALFFGLAVLASCMRALYGVTTKEAMLVHAEPQLMLLIIALFWIAGGGAYALCKEKRFRFTRKKIAYSILCGLLVYGIANFLMLAVKYGQASIVIPIANMSFIVALIISVMTGMEKMTWRKGVAITLAVASIISLSLG
jgi:drug/metabolite transporter (DMT)-like permease